MKHIIFNYHENGIIGEFENDSDFIDFVTKIVEENGDSAEFSILGISDAQEYIEEYCENLAMPIGICSRTKTLVYPSQVDGYVGYCPELDEDLYSIEFETLT